MTTEFGGGTRFAGGFGTGHIIEDEGTPLAQRVTLNFIGTGVTATDDPPNNATNVTISAGGHVIEDEGTPLAQRADLNFVGAGVTVTDAGGKTVVTIPGGGGGDVVVGTQQFGVGSGGIFPEVETGNGANAIAQRGAGTFNRQIKYIAFPDGADTLAYLDWFPPENWDLGTIKVKLYWTSELPSVAAETIEMLVSAVAEGNGDAIGGVDYGTPVPITDIFLAVDEEHLTPQSGSITIGGTPVAFDHIQLKFLRDISADNLQGAMQLEGAVIEFTITKGTSVG